MLRISKKRALILASVAAVAVAAIAYAFFTSTGSGTGSGTTAGAPSGITINQTGTAITGLYPGGAAKSLSGNFDNSNSGPVHLSSITATIASVTDSNGDAITGCDTSDYEITYDSGSSGAIGNSGDVPSGTGVGSWNGIKVDMVNKATSQNACQNAVVHIGYSAS